MKRFESVSMERSEGVSVALDHIMKMMDRSGERLLRSFSPFEGSEIRLGRVQGLQNLPSAASHQRPAAPSAAVGH